jgi:hypothetical protein
MSINDYDQAETEAIEALDSNMDVNEAPETEESTEVTEETGNQEKSEEGAAPQAQASTDDFNPQQWTLKFRGKDITPKDRQHLVNLAQQGYSYSQRAEELKRREEELTSQAAQYDKYKQLAEAFQANPQLQQRIMQMYSETQQEQGKDNKQSGQELAALQPYLQKVETLEQRLQAYDQKAADDELKAEFDKLVSSHEEDWETPNEEGHTLRWEILNHAHKNNFYSLESAYRDFMWDTVQNRTKADTLKKQAEVRRKQAKEGVVASKVTQSPPPSSGGPNFRGMSYDQIANHVLQNDISQ